MKNILYALLIITTSMSCSSIKYASDYLHTEQSLQFYSYSIEGECEKGINRILAIRVENALNSYLTSKGFVKSDNPDLLIQFFIKEEQKQYYSQHCDYYDRWKRGDQCSVRIINYEEGSIVIDAISTEINSIVWHGVMQGPSFDFLNNPNEKINEYIENLMNQFFLDIAQDTKQGQVENVMN